MEIRKRVKAAIFELVVSLGGGNEGAGHRSS
jgi:hypothetical protein